MQTALERATTRERFSGHRGDGIQFQRLLTGPPAQANSYELSIIHIADGYSTPRHRHNFDQLRLCLSGSFNYAKGRTIAAGDVLYVPEGTYYGPHRNEGEAELLLVQYGGNNGSGFLTYQELADGFTHLAARGRFDNGIYRPDPSAGPARNQDGYEAIWEHVKGVAVDYPAPRYDEPVLIHPQAFAWVPVPDTPGAVEKNLGVFGERRNQVRMVRLAAGHAASFGTPGCVDLLFCLDGQVEVDGQDLGGRDAVSLEPDEAAVDVVADTDATLFVTVLPDFSRN